MTTFDSNGVAINYIDEGQGPPVVLVHGFAATLEANWRAPGVVDALLAAGRRVIALDCRGHGKSGKPHDPEAYARTAMADDVIALVDHLGIARADLAGYSMGGHISATLMVNHPSRWNSVILAGVGDWILGEGQRRDWNATVSGLEAEDASSITDPRAKAFRALAEITGSDLKALAAVQRRPRITLDRAALAAVTLPVMVLLGSEDTLVGTGANWPRRSPARSTSSRPATT